jgi:hypothetical protein
MKTYTTVKGTEAPSLNSHKELYFIEHNVGNFTCSLGPVYEFVCISFRTDNLNCFRAS